MAISPFYSPQPPIPPWLFIDVGHDPVQDRARVRLALRCCDGDALVFDAKVDTYAVSRLSVPLTRREVLEAMHKQVVVELSKLEMES